MNLFLIDIKHLKYKAMVDLSIFLVTQEIAERSGVISTRYRTKDGRFILDSRDLSMVRLVGEEFVHGLSGVEAITEKQSKALIEEGGYQMGLPKRPSVQNVRNVSSGTEEETEETAQEEGREVSE